MHAYITRVHFRSRDEDGGYTIRSAVRENPMLHANITTLCLIERESASIEVLHSGNRIFDLFGSCDLDLDPMIFIIRTQPVDHGHIIIIIIIIFA